MSAKSPRQTLGDYVTIALSPALIMVLIGSLVFFLLEVVYAGQYEGRMQWILFWLVFAMVLVARIAIELSPERAALYGLGMGLATFVALQAYIQYPEGGMAAFGWAINLGLIGLIWWCANKLTWDCTFIDDKVDASGKGVLEAAGLDQTAPPTRDQHPEETDAKRTRGVPQFALLTWWDRYHRYVEEQRRKPHTPGVWVVYFSLAALPLFGLGQAFIPAEETARRHYTFWLMVAYVASGLGLLLTTSYLGLRRYLRQRKLQMPVAMTGLWLALGGGLIVVLMVLGALLPRPYGEYQLANLKSLGSPERQASRYALKRDGAGKGEGRASTDPNRRDPDAKDGSGQQPGGKGQGQTRGQSSGGQGGKNSSSSGNQRGGQRGQGNNARGQNSSGRGGRTSNRPGQQGTDRSERDENNQQNEDRRDQEEKRDQQRNGPNADKSSSQGSTSGGKQDTTRSSEDTRGSARSPSNNPISGFLSKLGPLATLLKWIVFGVLALVVLFLLFRSGLRFLANFTEWARRLLDALEAWWQGLFGRRPTNTRAVAEIEEAESRTPPRPFSSYVNPFLDGRAEHLAPNELARYSFEALQAWAWERRLGREPQETPLEFASRIADEVPALEAEARGVAGLYARAAYARGRLTNGALPILRRFWERLETVKKRPISA
jgi:hypothetical protein